MLESNRGGPRGRVVARTWDRRVVVLVGLLAMLLAALLGPASHAQDRDSADFGLAVEVGLGGQDQLGAWAPATITIAPDRPVAGDLVVRTEGMHGPFVLQRSVEVAAGATEQVQVLLPPGRDQVRVTLDDGSAADTVTAGGSFETAQIAVVLDDDAFPQEVGAVTDSISGEVFTTVPVSSDLLDLGPQVLESASSLTVDAEVLGRLDEQRRRSLATAVAHQGLHLVVAGVTDDPEVGRAPAAVADGDLEVLPSAWPMTVTDGAVAVASADDANAASILSGRGRVTWLSEAVGRDALSNPRTWGDLWTAGLSSDVQGWNRRPLVEQWALQQRGLRLPSSWGMAGWVIGYLVLVGLVALVVVRRMSRPQRAWVALPALALTLAAGAVIAAAGNEVQGGFGMGAATWIDGAGMETRVVHGDLAGLGPVLPGEGWQVQSLSWPGTAATRTADGVVLGSAEQNSGAALAAASRSRPDASPLTVEAARTADGVRVEVTNELDQPLRSVRVSAAGHEAVDLDVLAAGATEVVDLAPAPGDEPPWQPVELLEARGPGGAGVMGGEVIVEEGFAVEEGFEVAEEEIFVEDEFFVEEQLGATLAGAVNRRVADSPGLLWVRGVATDLVTRPTGIGTLDPDVVAVGVTPIAAEPSAAVTATVETWGSGAGEFEGMPGTLGGNGQPAWARLSLPTPAVLDHLRVDLPSPAGDDCESWQVWGMSGEPEIRTLCDGEEPECPDDAMECHREAGFMDICGDRGCETWERMQDSGGVAVWDRHDREFADWTDEFADQVADDPASVVGPLGDVVVQVTDGMVGIGQLQVGTGNTDD